MKLYNKKIFTKPSYLSVKKSTLVYLGKGNIFFIYIDQSGNDPFSRSANQDSEIRK